MDNKCYICLEQTEYKSPCKCQLYLCKDCFKKLLKHKNNKCSICKSNYESIKLLLSRNIELKRRNSPTSKSLIIDISEINITESDEDIEEEKSDLTKSKTIKVIIIIFIILLILIFGNLLNYGTIFNKWIIDLYVIMGGILILLLIILFFQICYGIVHLFYEVYIICNS
tara:strand:- start:262 stop:768 length:507 start_codon:yes stop_codon:yes gene_type:complete